MYLPPFQRETLTTRMAWLPNITPEDTGDALIALPPYEEARAFAAADPHGFSQFAEFIGNALERFDASDEEDAMPIVSPVMILVMTTPDGELFQVPEEATSQITLWAGACLNRSEDLEHAIPGIGLQLSRTLSGAAFADAGDDAWRIAGTIPGDSLPDVPAPQHA